MLASWQKGYQSNYIVTFCDRQKATAYVSELQSPVLHSSSYPSSSGICLGLFSTSLPFCGLLSQAEPCNGFLPAYGIMPAFLERTPHFPHAF